MWAERIITANWCWWRPSKSPVFPAWFGFAACAHWQRVAVAQTRTHTLQNTHKHMQKKQAQTDPNTDIENIDQNTHRHMDTDTCPHILEHPLTYCTCTWTCIHHLLNISSLEKKAYVWRRLPSGKECVHLGSKCNSNLAVQLVDLGSGCHVIMSIPSKMGKGYSMLC